MAARNPFSRREGKRRSLDLEALKSGLIGAGALTAIHETARRLFEEAPRMDRLGAGAIGRTFVRAGFNPPKGVKLQALALAGEVVSNSLYYALAAVGRPHTSLARGAALGLLAGVGGVVLPPYLGLSRKEAARTFATQAMTVSWYALGGLAAGAWARRRQASS